MIAKAMAAWSLRLLSVRPDQPDKPGGVYRWINEGHPIADAPQALLEIVCKPAPKKKGEADDIDDVEKADWNNFFNRYSESSKFKSGNNKWRTFNTAMLQHLSLWFPPLFHDNWRSAARLTRDDKAQQEIRDL
ncbi:hypothetical protein ACFIOY_21355 [Bradyrhizobium sp. TZ2]